VLTITSRSQKDPPSYTGNRVQILPSSTILVFGTNPHHERDAIIIGETLVGIGRAMLGDFLAIEAVFLVISIWACLGLEDNDIRRKRHAHAIHALT
jgi:hypothetical protein